MAPVSPWGDPGFLPVLRPPLRIHRPCPSPQQGRPQRYRKLRTGLSGLQRSEGGCRGPRLVSAPAFLRPQARDGPTRLDRRGSSPGPAAARLGQAPAGGGDSSRHRRANQGPTSPDAAGLHTGMALADGLLIPGTLRHHHQGKQHQHQPASQGNPTPIQAEAAIAAERPAQGPEPRGRLRQGRGQRPGARGQPGAEPWRPAQPELGGQAWVKRWRSLGGACSKQKRGGHRPAGERMVQVYS